MSNIKLGQLIEDEFAHRDAVHVAIAPVIAGARLRPGSAVGFKSDGTVDALGAKNLGIIDPFLPVGEVKPGQRCWMFMFPGTVTGLRHEWHHPEFPDSETKALAKALTTAPEPEVEEDGDDCQRNC